MSHGKIKNPSRDFQAKAKRTIDIAVSVMSLVLLSPLLLVVAILVKISSPGPVIFKQERIGKEGKHFNFYKFRTMFKDANDELHREYIKKLLKEDDVKPEEVKGEKLYKVVHDPRVTSIGYWLRKTSLDELPQLFNVLKGDMSLVGPRPSLPYAVQMYEEWQTERFRVDSGITGLWQVSGRNKLSYKDALRLDIQYVNNWNIWLDIIILFKTVPTVFFGKGVA
ncbi:MAG: exopolysaccharide biosynthesis polyprenyl glycosylphosphotransferase [Candidatus Omnitrophica bacterium]|nr:exopolysaccharide biosynthesis polyprenyl glycosylphosphotransferase [Candidatus Omnitrophota bacterium]